MRKFEQEVERMVQDYGVSEILQELIVVVKKEYTEGYEDQLILDLEKTLDTYENRYCEE